MVRVYMIETAFGVPAGSYNPKGYIKGRTYTIDQALAVSFTMQGVARLAKEEYEIESPQDVFTETYQKKIIKPTSRKGRPPKCKIDAL